MKRKNLYLLLVLVSINYSAYSQKLLSKLVAKTAGAQTSNAPVVSKLSDITPTIGYSSNLHPVEVGTVSQSFFEGWKTGAELIFVLLNNNNNIASSKVDGKVTIDGNEAAFSSAGIYYIVADPTNAPRKVEITTLSGEKSSFVLEPNKKQFKIKSINGLSEEIILDLSKDVEIELDDTNIPENTLLKVSIAINQVGIKSTYDVCYIKKGSKITVPAAAFRNINIQRDGKFKKSFISIGIDDEKPVTSLEGNIKSLYYTSNYSDGKIVTVKVEPKLNLGLEAKGKEGQMEYQILKPNAFTSRPFSHIKKLGFSSFSIKGTTYIQSSVIVQDKNVEKDLAQTTKTTTIIFPKQSDEVWNAVLSKMLPEVSKTFQTEFQATVASIDDISKQSSFKKINSFVENSNTEKEFVKGIGASKHLNPLTHLETYGINSLQEQLMKESNTDGLCKVNLELIISEDKEKAFLTPKFTYEITGKINGVMTNTKYVSGTITGTPIESDLIGLTIEYSSSGGGKAFKKDQKNVINTPASSISAEQLEKLIRSSDILVTFSKSLKQIIEAEKLNGDYEIVWNLQKL
ncbi:MAG: hypothetical protein HYU67_04970 [Flavobacteriia bacterium]|nr:hypothetical protein [Flavobacteriia bacterium]